jgi:hypothetical protein
MGSSTHNTNTKPPPHSSIPLKERGNKKEIIQVWNPNCFQKKKKKKEEMGPTPPPPFPPWICGGQKNPCLVDPRFAQI